MRELADKAKLPFYGFICFPIRVKDTPVEELFVVSRVSEVAILGRRF